MGWRKPVMASACMFFFLSKRGSPSLCIEEMHTALLYFIYPTQTGKKALQRSYKLKPLQTQVSKHHQTSTTLTVRRLGDVSGLNSVCRCEVIAPIMSPLPPIKLVDVATEVASMVELGWSTYMFC
jgi:hypothetical protein